jgi:hypothetical protein
MKIESLEQMAVHACEQEVKHALTKYNCTLIFEEIRHNGQLAATSFKIAKAKDKEFSN